MFADQFMNSKSETFFVDSSSIPQAHFKLEIDFENYRKKNIEKETIRVRITINQNIRIC